MGLQDSTFLLDSMRWTLMFNTVVMTLGFLCIAIMIFVTSHGLAKMVREVSQTTREVAEQVAEDTALLRESHALTAGAAAALENIMRLVVDPGSRTS